MTSTPEEYDCIACGACCREAYHVVEVDDDDPFVTLHPQLLGREFGHYHLPRPGGLCVALRRVDGGYLCDYYGERPMSCREFEIGGENCHEARVKVGLPALPEVLVPVGVS